MTLQAVFMCFYVHVYPKEICQHTLTGYPVRQ